MAHIRLDSVTRRVDATLVLDDVNVEIANGELLVLVGASGAGKTAILRAIAGLDPITSGRVMFDDVDMTRVPTAQRDIAMVFQNDTLFPRHTVRENIGFGLRVRRLMRREIEARVTAESRVLGIDHILDRWPDELSDGHRHLVQIARALVLTPRVFLLDEPLSKVDLATRARLRPEIRLLQQGYNVPMVYATNVPDETMVLADRVAVVHAGRLVQIGTPADVQANPSDLSTARLTGTIGSLDAVVERDSDGFWVTGEGFRSRAWAPVLGNHVGRAVTVGVRPEAVVLEPGGPVAAVLGRGGFGLGATGRDLVVGVKRLPTNIADDRRDGEPVNANFKRWHVFSANAPHDLICTVKTSDH